MDPMVTKFRPRMNEVVGLPRNFKKKNPKFTKKDYPPLTGYTAIHIGKVLNNHYSLKRE